MQSALATGDAALFDSRLLHCGCANDSQKTRAVFYVTFSRDRDWPLPGGLHGSNSIRAEDLRRWTLPDLLVPQEAGSVGGQ
jgi:ectoine hydroxylase-related dioxygenase (phytanoyl-CoA dioxygenase family)